jgi:hypothetical protein
LSISAWLVRRLGDGRRDRRTSDDHPEENIMPTYAALIYEAVEAHKPGDPEWMAQMPDYMAFGEAAGAAGVITGGAALDTVATATTIQLEGGKGGDLIVTDGPFAETKEVLTGFYLLDADDLDKALEWARQIPGAWNGRVEIRPTLTFDGDGA